MGSHSLGGIQRFGASAVLLWSLFWASAESEARPPAPGIGVAAGVVVPTSSREPSFAWGFYTDIPLISTFHITPSTVVYTLNPSGGANNSATDVSVNFKFMVPIGSLDIFFGVTAGLTVLDELEPHVGGLAGIGLNIVSNIDLFVQAAYRFIIVENDNINHLAVTAGPLFRFEP